MSEDPGRNGASWFAYCSNSPTGLVDPDGRGELEVWLSLIGIVGGLTSSDIFKALFVTALGLVLAVAVSPGVLLCGGDSPSAAVVVLLAEWVAGNWAQLRPTDGGWNWSLSKQGSLWRVVQEVIGFYGGLGGFYGLYMELEG